MITSMQTLLVLASVMACLDVRYTIIQLPPISPDTKGELLSAAIVALYAVFELAARRKMLAKGAENGHGLDVSPPGDAGENDCFASAPQVDIKLQEMPLPTAGLPNTASIISLSEKKKQGDLFDRRILPFHENGRRIRPAILQTTFTTGNGRRIKEVPAANTRGAPSWSTPKRKPTYFTRQTKSTGGLVAGRPQVVFPLPIQLELQKRPIVDPTQEKSASAEACHHSSILASATPHSFVATTSLYKSKGDDGDITMADAMVLHDNRESV